MVMKRVQQSLVLIIPRLLLYSSKSLTSTRKIFCHKLQHTSFLPLKSLYTFKAYSGLNTLEMLYTSEKFGDDECGDGTEIKPFKTVLKAIKHHGKEPYPQIMVDGKEEGKKFEEVSKAQLKKLTKILAQEQRKSEEKEKKEEHGPELQHDLHLGIASVASEPSTIVPSKPLKNHLIKSTPACLK